MSDARVDSAVDVIARRLASRAIVDMADAVAELSGIDHADRLQNRLRDFIPPQASAAEIAEAYDFLRVRRDK